jgi:mono/diheme cytochrome c family protein/plastocyanin
MKKEWLARGILLLSLAVVIAIPSLGWWQQKQGLVVHAHMAETGGWNPESLTAKVGIPLHLRLTSDDVTHGFAVGKLDQPSVDVLPGEMTDVTLVFDKPGKYTFYCTRWCSVNHWRMRGTIEVTGPQTTTEPSKPPLYVTLGLDIDAEHHADVIPSETPAAWREAQLNRVVPEEYTSRDYYLTHSPVDLWKALRSETAFSDLADQQIWDLVAWVWQSNTSPDEIQLGAELFASNCAACHGENGAGDGVFADQLVSSLGSADTEHTKVAQTQRPSDFTDPNHMLSTSPAHLQGKIIRGGMGTGMPYWGPIFTEDQTRALVAYLWTYQFNLEVLP